MSDLVKLEWIINDDDCAEVDTPFGTYMVGKTSYGGWWSYCFDEYYDEGSYRCKDMAEGMSLAEKHWRDRVQPITKPLTDHIEELESELSLRTNLHEECIYLLKSTEQKLAKAVEALGEAIYLLDPDEEDIAKETGLHRIVTTYAELTGGKDGF